MANQIYGVFFIKNGKWELAATYGSKFNAHRKSITLSIRLALSQRCS